MPRKRRRRKPETFLPKLAPRIKAPKLTADTKTIMLAVCAMFAVFLLIYLLPTLVGNGRSLEGKVTPPTTTQPATEQAATTGTLVIALKDEDHKLPGGAVVKSMNFTVAGVDVHAKSGGWTQLASDSRKLDLLKYTTTYAVVAKEDIDAGSYDKVRLKLSNGSVSIVHTLLGIYSPKVYGLDVPAETDVAHEFNITAGQTLTLVLDFDIENSLVRTSDVYTLTPVIKVSQAAGELENTEAV
jgi:hypothetical protein